MAGGGLSYADGDSMEKAVSCKTAHCDRCRLHGMAEWGLIAAWRMREGDDAGVGGVKRDCPHGGWSPFNWWYETALGRRACWNRSIVSIPGGGASSSWSDSRPRSRVSCSPGRGRSTISREPGQDTRAPPKALGRSVGSCRHSRPFVRRPATSPVIYLSVRIWPLPVSNDLHEDARSVIKCLRHRHEQRLSASRELSCLRHN